ncbi:MAG: SIR2 family protein [Syntrophorhabdaceae bacterium]
MIKSKTVYILGAGFSYPANIPGQAELLKKTLEYKPTFADGNILKAQGKVNDFLDNVFDSNPKISLEDVFTIFDRCILSRERFRTYNWQELCETRKQLVFLILSIINKQFSGISKKASTNYEKFAECLVKKRYEAKRIDDTIAVISPNWDTVLEYFIEKYLESANKPKTRIDYCTYTHGLDNKQRIPHLNIKAKGYYNIKIMKLHGSMNWLYCSNCGRLYVDKSDIGLDIKECPYCEITPGTNFLEPIIITPSLLKELNNLHIKNIWQNAFINLQEASEVIFVGYSLPLADFEFKHVLKKGIKVGTRMKVILVSQDKSNGTAERYKNFFGTSLGKKDLKFVGWEKWLKQCT